MKNLGVGIIAVLVGSNVGCEIEELAGTSTEPAIEGRGSFERLVSTFDLLVPIDAVVEKVAGGFQFIEGPVWIPGQPGALLFSDIDANTVYRWTEGDGSEIFLHPVTPDGPDTGGTGGSNGLARDPEGRLILCEHGNRRVARLEEDGSRTTLADRYENQRLNSPNDIVFHSTGAAFFTDPPYGLEEHDESLVKEQSHNGIYRLDPGGTITLVSARQTRPNGIGLSPDERTLYVANSDGAPNQLWMSYPVLDDLTLGEGAVFFDANEMKKAGWADGLALDRSGNVYATGPGGVLVIDASGQHLGTITLDEIPTNAGWGDDGKSLYITAHTSLYRIKLSAEGLVYSGN
jgi:gluconolactonase